MAKLGRLSQWALNFSDANWSKINQNLSGFALNDLGDVVTSAKELRNCLDKVIYSAEYKIRRPRMVRDFLIHLRILFGHGDQNCGAVLLEKKAV